MYSYICAHQLVLGIARYFSASVVCMEVKQCNSSPRLAGGALISTYLRTITFLTMLQPTLLELLQAIYYMITRNWKNSSSIRWIHQPFVAASRMVFIVQQNGLPQSHPKTQKRPKLLFSQYNPTLLTIDLTRRFLSIPTVQYICTYWVHVQTFGG